MGSLVATPTPVPTAVARLVSDRMQAEMFVESLRANRNKTIDLANTLREQHEGMTAVNAEMAMDVQASQAQFNVE